MPEYNPLAFSRAGADQANALFDTYGRSRAGRQFADGDQAGAANTLARYGMIDDASQIQARQAQQAAAQRTLMQDEQDDDDKWILQGMTGLRGVPYDQRASAYQSQIRPRLAARLSAEELSRIDAADLTDAELDAGIGALGGSVAAPYANDRTGPNNSVLRPDRYTGTYTPVYTPEFDPRTGAPAGYMWADESRTSLKAIPGGGADPAVASGLAASRRAPPRARSSGGGSSSGGAARPAASSSSRPWERSW